jgi:hypothetical protein
VGSIAWPSALAIIVLMFRSNIAKWIEKLMERPPKELEVGPSGIKLSWDNKLEEARVEAAPIIEAEPTTPELPVAERDFLQEMEDVAGIAPSAAVLESYRRLELLLNELIRLGRVEVPKGPISSRRLAQLAFDAGIISENELALYYDLASLRNVAAHQDGGIDFEGAMKYVHLAGLLYETMSRLVQNENWEPGDR